jgi:type VI secretion system protein VasJ
MLGIGKKRKNFQVAAHGKHPAFNDYFSLNMDFPMASALVNWVEKGTGLKKTHDNSNIHAFRFWVRGIKKGELIFGVIRDSSDNMGRVYPLIIMAKVFVKDWEKRWNYILISFETIFRTFEDITASRYENFREFETRMARVVSRELAKVRDYGMEWQYNYKTLDERSRLPEIMLAWFNNNSVNKAMTMQVAALFERFASDTPQRKPKSGLFGNKREIPGAVFLGGLPESPFLSIFSRPLRAEDFLNLF